MRILLVTETLHVGGAETFVVRLANKLVKQHDVTVLNLHPELSKKELIDQLSYNIKLENVYLPNKVFLNKLDRLFYFIGIDFSFVQFYFKKKIKRKIEVFAPTVVHSHLFKTDFYVSCIKNNSNHKFNHITTNHGDYLLYESQNPVGILNYSKKLNFTLHTLDTMVMISDAQVNWLNQKTKLGNFSLNYAKVINGYEYNLNGVGFRQLHIKNDDEFVFGMVARGIRQKGWESVIKVFKSLCIPKTKLFLLGEGPELDRLKRNYKDDRLIHFAGYKPNPIDYIQLFDVCLLPSFYEAESLPTVIIEYLMCKKPILTTDIGEIKYMLTSSDHHAAGLFIKYNSTGIDESDLFEKMKLIYENAEQRVLLAKRTDAALKKFDMDECISSYLKIYSTGQDRIHEI